MGDLLALSSRVIDLETLVDQVLEMMNAGATLDAIVHTVRVPDEILAKPYLRPLFDEPEVHAARAQVYWERRAAERSLMSRRIYGAAARESEEVGRAVGST